MLNFAFDTSFWTHELPRAMDKLTEFNPDWFRKGRERIEEIRGIVGNNDFEDLMRYIDENCADEFVVIEMIK